MVCSFDVEPAQVFQNGEKKIPTFTPLSTNQVPLQRQAIKHRDVKTLIGSLINN